MTKTEEDNQVEMTALFVLGIILPVAGFIWGPGPWWGYVIWISLGAVAMLLYDHFEKEGS
jgi:hypothetical protein